MVRIIQKILISFFILAVASLSVVIYAVPGVTDALTRTDILQYENLRVTDEVTCYFVREETVYAAARGGAINYYYEDGVQVKAGTRILEIVPGVLAAPDGTEREAPENAFANLVTGLGDGLVTQSDYSSTFNGVVSYFIDGYESMFTPETMRDLKYEQVRRLNPEPVNVVRTFTQPQDPLYKICAGGKWYILCWTDASSIAMYEIERGVTIELPAGQVRAVVTDIIADGDKWLIIFETNRYYEDFGRIRTAEATVVTSDYNGIVIQNQSITVEEDGTIGVYVRSRSGTYGFRPIKIIAADGQTSLVEVSYFLDEDGKRVNTVEVYDEILKDPPEK